MQGAYDYNIQNIYEQAGAELCQAQLKFRITKSAGQQGNLSAIQQIENRLTWSRHLY